MEIVRLTNPISKTEIDEMIRRISSCDRINTLLINFGKHDFQTLEVLKYCKLELLKIENQLLEIKKIAFVTPPLFINDSINNLSWFHSEKKAMEWLEN